MAHLLLVEDDLNLGETLVELLELEGFQVNWVSDGKQALDVTFMHSYDLLLLDVNVPFVDGFELLSGLRESGDETPAIFITAMSDIASLSKGFEVGADDYVGKPVTPRVLLARIRALLRRGSADARAEILRRGNLHINVPSREVTLDGNHIELTTTEFDLLVLLARRAGRVQERSKLIEELRGISFHSFDRTVDVIISRLRRKLGDSSTGELIKTVRGVGYLMVMPEED